jgi:hypothetical protein
MIIMAQSTNPILIELRQYLRPKGSDELWDLLLKLKGLDEMHALKDNSLYQTNHRDKRTSVAAMTAAYNGIDNSNIPTSTITSLNNNHSSIGMSSLSMLTDTIRELGASPIVAHQAVTSMPPSCISSSASSSSSSTSTISIHMNDVAISDTSASDSKAPHRFTQDECNLFDDKLSRCRKQTSNTNNVQWHTLAYIFEHAASQPSQSISRTIWPRSEERLQNFYSNNVRPVLKKQRTLESNQTAVSNTQQPVVINSSCTGSAAETGGPVDNGELVVAMPLACTEREMRKDDLTTEEDNFIIDTGKNMKMSGQEVNGGVLFKAYRRHFQLWTRDPQVLADRWQKWFRNQKKAPGTRWYKEYRQKVPSTKKA